jgi:transcriptional regulator with XRE-family HTH domain
MSDEQAVMPLAAVVIGNVRAIRKRLRWSAAELAERLSPEVGLSRSAIANAESGRRDHVTVDELAALAEALGVTDPWALTQPEIPPCETCHDAPPAGFRCLVCDLANSPIQEVTDGR